MILARRPGCWIIYLDNDETIAMRVTPGVFAAVPYEEEDVYDAVDAFLRY